MRVVSRDFLNNNEYISYPIDSRATYEPYIGADVSVLNSLLTDLRLTVPKQVAAGVYISGISITERLVTITFMGVQSHPFSDSTPAATLYTTEYSQLGGIVLAQVYARRDINPEGQIIRVTPQVPGVGGWVVFGSGVKRTGSWSFAGGSSSLIAERCITHYDHSGVTTLGKKDFTATVHGNTFIVGQGDIEAVAGTYNSEPATILQFSGSAIDAQQALSEYVGACGGRPESETCTFKAIKTINGIRPELGSLGQEIVLILDWPLYANPATSGDSTLTISSDVTVEENCPPRFNFPETCEGVTECPPAAQQRLTTAPLAQLVKDPVVFAGGDKLQLALTGPAGIFESTFVYVSQSPKNPHKAVFSATPPIEVGGELVLTLELNGSTKEWQMYGPAGVNMQGFGYTDVALRDTKQLSDGTRLDLYRPTLIDKLGYTKISVTVEAADPFPEQGTYYRSGPAKYHNVLNASYTLQLKPGSPQVWVIYGPKGDVIAAGEFSPTGFSANRQTYRRADGKSASKYITVRGLP